jgi:HAD superfamily hydrolase (TIGR01509 family)
MTTPPRTLAEVLAATGPILLDFDGPVCTVFATLPAGTVAAQQRQILTDHGATLPTPLAQQTDPLEVLRYTATLDNPQLTAHVDDQLRQAEQHAIGGATPTPYAREVIVAAHHAGRPLAIVSNNSEPAIAAYLAAHRITSYIGHITGRVYAQPALMKPHPWPILTALTALAAQPAACVMLGDSPSDIQAAHAAGMHTIGYANKPGKAQRLAHAGADALAEGTTGMGHLARLLHAENPPA